MNNYAISQNTCALALVLDISLRMKSVNPVTIGSTVLRVAIIRLAFQETRDCLSLLK